MRYQRLSPDCFPLGGGGGGGPVSWKPVSRISYKDDDAPAVATDGSRLAAFPVDSKPLHARAPNPTPPSSAGRSPARHHPSDSSVTASPSSTGCGDLLLQWGHHKRSRCRRDSAAAATSAQRRQPGFGACGKVQRRSSAPPEKLMPPSPPSAGSRGGGQERPLPDKTHRSATDAVLHVESRNHLHDLPLTANGSVASEKLGVKPFALPRIYISLSRKEKEDDFLAMKGAKLPQRPKKRAKIVDKSLQFVFPGMWLSDLTKGRYEVREKKCVKKKRRGLKGMESMDSDSE